VARPAGQVEPAGKRGEGASVAGKTDEEQRDTHQHTHHSHPSVVV
jgi:hypothetical protein